MGNKIVYSPEEMVQRLKDGFDKQPTRYIDLRQYHEDMWYKTFDYAIKQACPERHEDHDTKPDLQNFAIYSRESVATMERMWSLLILNVELYHHVCNGHPIPHYTTRVLKDVPKNNTAPDNEFHICIRTTCPGGTRIEDSEFRMRYPLGRRNGSDVLLEDVVDQVKQTVPVLDYDKVLLYINGAKLTHPRLSLLALGVGPGSEILFSTNEPLPLSARELGVIVEKKRALICMVQAAEEK
jgi:hypothetical protein